jgi:hypothetical protein
MLRTHMTRNMFAKQPLQLAICLQQSKYTQYVTNAYDTQYECPATAYSNHNIRNMFAQQPLQQSKPGIK